MLSVGWGDCWNIPECFQCHAFWWLLWLPLCSFHLMLLWLNNVISPWERHIIVEYFFPLFICLGTDDFSAPLSASLIFFLCLLFLFHYLDFLTSPTCRKLFSSAILLKIQGLKVRQHETFRLCSFLSIFFLKGFIQMFSCSPDSLAGQTCRKVSGQWTEMSDKGTLQARTSFIYGLYLTTLSAPPPRFPQTTQCQWG